MYYYYNIVEYKKKVVKNSKILYTYLDNMESTMENKKNYELVNISDFIHSINTNQMNNSFDVKENTSEEIKNEQPSDLKDNNSIIEIKENTNNIDDTIDPDNILSKEEYEDLCMKYANGDNLTKDELIMLRDSTKYFMRQESNKSLKISNSGFSTKYILFYICFVTIVFLVLLGIVLIEVN